MNKITFPLKVGMKNSEVSDLQDALKLLLDKAIIMPDDEAARRELVAGLKHEYVEQIYGETTNKLVSIFQKEQHLEVTGEVDEATAELINARVSSLEPKRQMLDSKVSRSDGTPLARDTSLDAGLNRVKADLLGTAITQPEKKISKKQTFLVKPQLLFNNLTDLSKLDREETDFVGTKLNEYFRDELLNAIGEVSAEMSKALQNCITGINYETLKDSELTAVLLQNILPELKKDAALSKEACEIENSLANMPSKKVSDLLYLSVPLQDNPIFQAEINKARTLEYAKLVKLSDEVAQQLLDKNLYLENADESILVDLVKEKIINSQQKADLQMTIDLGRLTGDNIPFISTLITSKITSTLDLVSWEKADWKQLITTNNIPLPSGETSETYVEKILLNIEKTYPSQVLFSTLLKPRQKAQINRLDSLNHLLKSHDKLIDGKNPAKIDRGTLAAEKHEVIKKDLQALTDFANTYRHLDIAGLINNKDYSLAQKKKAINGRIQLIDTFYKNNPRLDLRLVNFFDNKAGLLNWQNISETDQPLVKKQLMAYQRILDLAEETSDRQMLLSKGLDSAVAIADLTDAELIKTSGLSLGKSRQIYSKAQETSLSVGHCFETIRDTFFGPFKYITLANNISPELLNDLRDIDGLEELFGSQNFCSCEECKSILSPAAYFVDLMHFIEQYISNPVFASLPDHPLYLKIRRGNLWKLNLTCENTYTLVPYLTIVNEVLEEYLEKVEKGDVFEILCSKNISFALPFNLPLEELRIYLDHFGTKIHKLCQILRTPDQKIWRAKLNLSNEEYNVIVKSNINGVKLRFGNPSSFTSPDFDVQELLQRAGITRQQLDELLTLKFNPDLNKIKIQIQSQDLQDFREVFLNLTNYHLDFIHRFIRLWRKTDWTIPELDLVLLTLKEAGLLRSRKSIRTQPLIIYENLLKPATVWYVARMIDLQESLKLTVEELCAMVYQLPVSPSFAEAPSKQSDKRLFERLFDVRKLFAGDYLFSLNEVTENDSIRLKEVLKQRLDIELDNTGKIEKIDNGNTIKVSTSKNKVYLKLNDQKTRINLEIDDGRRDELIVKMENSKLNVYDIHETPFNYHHYSLNINDTSDQEIDPKTPILLGGLGISETELLLLFDLLKAEMPFNNDGNTRLNREKISLLYRHARLAKALRLSVEELIQALNLNCVSINSPIKNLDQINKLQEFRDWLKSSPFNVFELRFILDGGESNTVKYKVNFEAVVELVKDIKKQSNLIFGKELLSEIEVISKGDSEKIIEQMVTAKFITATVEGYSIDLENYRLTQDFNTILADSGVSSEVQAKAPEIREKFNEFHPFVISFTTSTNIGKDLYHQLVKFVSIDMSSNDFVKSLNTEFDEKNANPVNPTQLNILFEVLKQLERTKYLLEKLKFEPETVKFLAENQAVLGISDLRNLTLNDLKAITLYKKLTSQNPDTLSSVQTALNNYQVSRQFSAKDIPLLADFWQEDKSLIDSLVRSLTLPTVPIQALAYVRECLDVCRMLGINGFSLLKLIDDEDFSKLSIARDIALGAFSSKYEDENIRKEKLEPYQDKINILKRDALCDYIIAREKELKFKDLSDLYAFFLLDVEMSSCFHTSRLVCAISGLQLYVHRILTNLEQSESTGLNVLNGIKNLSQFKEEWEWRKNYRVWEANRKVFLYSENYIEPDLRDDKTPVFKELEDELLQQKITKESAEAAYKKYISQFAELARLRIAGSYYHKDSDKDYKESDKDSGTYHFFGCTQQDPYQYYYRTWNEKLWTPWEKIELGINSNSVSAVIYRGKLYLFWMGINDKEITEIKDGSSNSLGFSFDIDILYSYLNENGKWIPPQRLDCYDNGNGVSSVKYKNGYEIIPTYYNDRYKLFPDYKKVYPGITEKDELFVHVRTPPFNSGVTKDKCSLNLCTVPCNNVSARIDLFSNSLYESDVVLGNSKSFLPSLGRGEYLCLLKKNGSNKAKFARLTDDISTEQDRGRYMEKSSGWSFGPFEPGVNFGWSFEPFEFGVDFNAIPGTPEFDDEVYKSDIDIVHNSKNDYIIKIGNQQYLTYFRSSRRLSLRETVRLGTSLIDSLGKTLFTEGLEDFLSLETQKQKEDSIKIDFYFLWFKPHDNLNHIDFLGAYGNYYRELFFHIPYLIANHLNANQKFKEAKWWYERIFDPTAGESPDDKNDRNWRYIEFRDYSLPKIKEILTDKAAIEQYKTDPFNPHAIARLRPSAYQKGIVMKYIDNLLDWGDSLFAQDTTESINEATMLYVLASDILGKRPVEVGKCDTAKDINLTYEKIGPSMGNEADFLINLENWNLWNHVESRDIPILAAASGLTSTINTGLEITKEAELALSETSLENRIHWPEIGTPQYRMRSYKEVAEIRNSSPSAILDLEATKTVHRYPNYEVVKQSTLVFCVPPNYDLLKYWDRVEDRLFKIRHCMNISGVRRQLALFQPPIDPMALVRAKAAGLSLEEILSMLEAQLPPYRFSYLIEKAKQYTQTVQAFGSALLSALEKKDVEELTLLRSVHEYNILLMTKKIKEQHLQEAQYQLQAVVDTQTNVQNRINYYQGLINEGLTGWEITQQVSRHTSTYFKIDESGWRTAANIAFLIPQTGSPFAMTYGGQQLGNSLNAIAGFSNSMSAIAEAISASAGLEASFNRREQEWGQQLLLAQQELKQVEKQRLAAEIRQLIAENDLTIHETNLEQADELDTFYKNKFTSLGLYNYLSTTLNRCYREAYNIAYDMAKMAEVTYRFERNDDSAIFITGDNWQFDRAGLLAGERLLLQLQQMERAYIEKNTRDYEVTQSFSLALLDPAALLDLREKGTCDFEIPEIAFDLFYPGQYRRLIKSVRITIPCVTGPYTNVSATLTLNGNSQVRKEAKMDYNNLGPSQIQHSTSIATSTAQNDGGLFELNFRDERYLPFEGAGAISEWNLTLPSKLRLFNYDTISDVIIHISYTAQYDGGLRDKVENNIIGAISAYAEEVGLHRLFSLKHEFPDAFYKLLNPSGTTQTAEFEITNQHFPQFLAEKKLSLPETALDIYLKPKNKKTVITSGQDLRINNSKVKWDSNNSGENEGDLKVGDVLVKGNPVKKWTVDAGTGSLNKEEIDDILILLKYKIEKP